MQTQYTSTLRIGRFILALVAMLLTTCEKPGDEVPRARPDSAPGSAMRTVVAARVTAPEAASTPKTAPSAPAARDAGAIPRTVDGGPPAARHRPPPGTSRAEMIKYLSKPYFVAHRGAGYLKRARSECLYSEYTLLQGADPDDMQFYPNHWDEILIIYRHIGSDKADERAARRLATALGGRVQRFRSGIKGLRTLRQKNLDLIRALRHYPSSATGRLKPRGVVKGSYVDRLPRHEVNIGSTPLGKKRALWRKAIRRDNRLIWNIKTKPCMAGTYLIKLPHRNKAKCQAAARRAAKYRRVMYAICCVLQFLSWE